ncbi:olfactory receptor 11L1-like [Xenopus tropicalis]|uniref:Olfactory receptor 11L1-like n=1 Tax=Xenopus tropicalis TaxID=8364 RepID=A0A8J1JC31_XENTR|nr:olfactory receptor 11L1-like [Xenopus tropicalis]
MTVCESSLVIALVWSTKNLQSPMYFFLQQLALSDILQTSTVVPAMLRVIIYEGATMALTDCITQFYFFAASEAFQCINLAVMSYDRYVAICNPLRYSSIMTLKVCVQCILWSWLLAFSVILITANAAATQHFCDKYIIDHFFCDFFPLLELSCSDTFFVRIEVTLLSVPVVFTPFILIIGSYICIAHEILKIVSSIGRQKAFSTCSSHLAVVSIFYGTLIGIYVVPSKQRLMTISKLLSLLYTLIIPFVNPMIYSLRNKDIIERLKAILVSGKQKGINI